MTHTIIIGSQDAEFHLLATHILNADGFNCVSADNVQDIFRLSLRRSPVAVVLDCRAESLRMVIEVCDRLKSERATSHILTIAVIGRSAEQHHLDLLKVGVDETLKRPISPSTLLDVLKTDALPRRTEKLFLRYDDLEMNVAKRRVVRGGATLPMAQVEFNILKLLLSAPEQVFTRDEIISAAWPPRVYVEPRTVDVHIGRLRKLLNGKNRRDIIRTVRSVGYSLDANTTQDGG
ncbi:response regulator transcription factor [Neorhizobium sp. BT27B]|uniref:response regulator transcription factor n=1 Tax=Neorhizobium sp. BT27B TaxID=3142625 RepID=UPI003D2712DA